jgi:hypothetical protein
MLVYNKHLLINMHGMNIKNPFPLIHRKLLRRKIYFYSTGCVGKFIGLRENNIVKFKSGDTEQFTNCLQGIGHV